MSKLLNHSSLVRTYISRGFRCRCPTEHPYSQSPTYVVTFVRHGESTWNACNLFTGWFDAPLTENGAEEALKAGKVLRKEAMCYDIVFTSKLKRAKDTAKLLFSCGQEGVKVVEDYHLNERHYGALTGYNKDDLVRKFGKAKVAKWRRSFATIPPPMLRNHPCFYIIKKIFPDIYVPKGESLKMTMNRALRFWRSTIVPEIKSGQRVLIVSHNNTLRAIVKYLEGFSDEEILKINFGTAEPFTYTLDTYMKPIRNKRMKYLMDAKSTTC